MVLKKAGGLVGAQPPPRLQTSLSRVLGFENPPAWRQKEKRGAWGRAATPPFANTFITVSETVHIMGSVFAGAKILEVSLKVLKKSGGLGGGGGQPHLQTPLSRVLRGSICVLSMLLG